MSAVSLYEIIRGKRAITADTTLRFGKFFGTAPEYRFWQRLQNVYDPRRATEEAGEVLGSIKPIAATP